MADERYMEIEGEQYELRFNDRRIDIIEKMIGGSIIGAVSTGFVKQFDLRVIFSQGLKKVDGPYAPQKFAEDAFKSIRDEYGYEALILMISDALERDCGFFFRES